MNIKPTIFPVEKRKIPYDKVIKNLLRIIHVLTFAVIFGACFYKIEYNHYYNSIIVFTGLLMIFREIYKNGIWLVQTRGILTIIKICLIFCLIFISKSRLFHIVLLVSIIGILSSHLPKHIRKYTLIKVG